MIFMTACQPTPEETVVRSKDKDLVQEVVIANEEENAVELIEDKNIIQEQIEAINKHLYMEIRANDRVNIVVDAEVEVPEFDKIPLVRAQPENITQEQLEILIEETAGDNPVYYQNTGGASIWSQEEIQGLIYKLKSFSQNESLESSVRKRLENSLSLLEKELPVSRPTGEEELYSGILPVLDNSQYYSSLTVLKSYLGKTKAATYELCQSFNKMKDSLVFRNQEYGEEYTYLERYDGKDADKIDMSYAECKAMAENLIRKMDGEDTNMAVFSSSIGYSIDTYAGHTKETSPQCYHFSFAREYNGTYARAVNYMYKNDNINYREAVGTEKLYVVVDNSGICSFRWQNCSKYVETVTEDVPLVDLETVTNAFQDYCGFKFAWVPDYDNFPDGVTATININRVELNMMMSLEKNDIGSYIMIPVWDYIGDINYDQEIKNDIGTPINGQKDISIITVNAIDGTVIDRQQGY
jgi:hypothetical protein